MKWRALFTPVVNLDPAEAGKFMAARPSGGYQLLDVRQPGEYEQEHLAGARLIPLKQLPERLGELDPDQPLLVYCAIGGRSRAAAQYLNGQGFRQVYNLSGGIKAWQGRKAAGPELQGLELLDPEADFADSLGLAYALEDGLQRFYLRLAEGLAESGPKELLGRLAGFEDRHKAWLAGEFEARGLAGDALPALAVAKGEVMEGGGNISAVLAGLRPEALDLGAILDLAMMFETQALDLYGRLAHQALRPEARALFLKLADEESRHLGYLEQELEEMIARGAPPGA